MDPIDLTTYKSPFEKIRLGKVFDGGYIIANIPNVYSLIISGGILDDISFENDFINKYNVKCVAFDGTIDALPGCNNDITFFKKNISNENNSTTTNLHDIIDSNTSLFLKMDIEGWEIPWIKSLTNDQMNKFEQMVIEFHNPFSKKEKDIFKKINKTHYLIHFHPNNCCGVVNHHGVIIPKYFECTYVHKKYFIALK